MHCGGSRFDPVKVHHFTGYHMKTGEYWISKSNPRIGLRIEDDSLKNRKALVQHVDMIEGQPVRSYIFEEADLRKIRKNYARTEIERPWTSGFNKENQLGWKFSYEELPKSAKIL